MDGRHQVAWHVSPTDSDSISSNSRIHIISGRDCKRDPPTFDYIRSAWIVRPWFPIDFPSSQVEICANFAQAMLSVLKVIQKFHGKVIIHRRGTKKSVKQIQKCRRITQNLTCRVFNIDLTYFFLHEITCLDHLGVSGPKESKTSAHNIRRFWLFPLRFSNGLISNGSISWIPYVIHIV